METTVCSAWNYSLTFPRGPRCGYGYTKELYESVLTHGSCGTILDVGANWGQSSLPLLSRGWRLIAFEPVKATAEHAAFNFEQNRIPQTRGVVIAAAASNLTGWSSVYLPGRDDNAALSSKAATANVGGSSKEIRIRTVRLDDYLASIGDASDIRAAKIDTQGHELEVLRGLGDYLRTLRPVLIVENDAKLQRKAGHTPNGVREYLETFGYEAFCLRDGQLQAEAAGVPRCYDVIYRASATAETALDEARASTLGCNVKLGPCDTQLASSDHNQSALLVFVHIPKAAGTSALSDLRHRGYRTSYFSQAEPCLRDVYCRAKGATHVTLLRSPRDHILSQYHMCRDSEWGRLHASSALPATFEAWLDHFLAPNSTSQLDAFNCYNPWNMQARALTCSVASGSEACRNSLEQTFVQRCEQWGSELHRPSRVDSLEPPVPSALSSLDSMVQLAGVVELYSESWCLLELRMRRELQQSPMLAKLNFHFRK